MSVCLDVCLAPLLLLFLQSLNLLQRDLASKLVDQNLLLAELLIESIIQVCKSVRYLRSDAVVDGPAGWV